MASGGMGCKWSGEKADFDSIKGGIDIDPVCTASSRPPSWLLAPSGGKPCGVLCVGYVTRSGSCGSQVEESLHIKAWRDSGMRQRVLQPGPSGEAHDISAIQEVCFAMP